jgi:hypothetical protein
MDDRAFDELVARLTSGPSRRDAVRGLVAGAASLGVPALAEAKQGKGSQVAVESKKKKFCFCPGDNREVCTPENCVDCEYLGKIKKKRRDKIRKKHPFSFRVGSASECPDTPASSTTSSTTSTSSSTSTSTSTTETTPTTTTTPPGP